MSVRVVGEAGESEQGNRARRSRLRTAAANARSRLSSAPETPSPANAALIGGTGPRKRSYEEMEQELASTQRELSVTKRKLLRAKQRNVAVRKALSRAKTDRLTHTWGIRSDGTLARLYNVTPVRAAKKKAVDEQWIRQSGALKRRKGIGGLEYTLPELIASLREIQAEGLGSRTTLAQRRSADAHARANEVQVMVPDTRGCRRGLNRPIDPFPRPCEQVMRQFQLAACLATFKAVPDIAANATSITSSADGKAFGVHHTLGCVTDFLTMKEVGKDAFGQAHFEPTKLSMCMPLLETANKIASDVLDREGKLHTLVSPLAFGIMATAANMDEVTVSQGANTALDGAADNRGQGNLKIAMDAMCSDGSIQNCATVKRTMWAHAREKIHGVGLYAPIKRFYRARSGSFRDQILLLRARRRLLRKERELAAGPRLRQREEAAHAAKEAAIRAKEAGLEADRLASEARQPGKTGGEQSLLRQAAMDARRRAAEARLAAREAKRRVTELKRRKAPSNAAPAAIPAAAAAAADGAAPPENAVPVAPVPVAAAAAADGAAPPDNAVPVAPVPAAAAAAADGAAPADNAVPVAPVPAAAAAADDNAAISAGHAPQAADAAAREPADNLDDDDSAYQLPAALRPRQAPIRLDVSGSVQKCPEAMERLFKRTMYEKLLRRVLKFERFLRWFMRLWYSTAQGAQLIKVQILNLKKCKGSTASGEDSTVVTDPGPGSVRRMPGHSVALNLELMMTGLTNDEQRLVWMRIEQLFDFEIKKSDDGIEFVVWKKLERDRRFGDRVEHAKALRRRVRLKWCDDWGRSIYGNEWRLAGAELVESWEACKSLGDSLGVPSDEWMPPAKDAPADAGQLPMQNDPPANPRIPHHQVGSQLIQVRLTQAGNFWPALRRAVGLEDWADCGKIQRQEYWYSAHRSLDSEQGFALKNALLLANKFRSMFWSRRPRKCHQGVSMGANPARFWGCYDQRLHDESGEPIRDENGEPIIQESGVSVQCVCHRSHNGSSRMMIMMDREFTDKIVSVTTFLHDENVKGHVISNAKHFVFPNEEVDKRTTMYSDARKKVDENARQWTPPTNSEGKPEGFHFNCSMQEIAACVDPAKGIGPPATCAAVRWATLCKSAASMAGRLSDILAFGVGRKGGVGKTPQDETDALASIFSEKGFVSDEHRGWVLSKQAGPFFKILVAAQSKTQMSIVRFLSKVVVDPLLAIASEPNACSRHMMGMGSYPRALLRILSRVIWASTGTRMRPAAIGHRVDPAATEWASGSWIGKGGSLRLLNPRCGPAVQRELASVFDEDWHPDIQQGIVTAVEVLVSQFQRIAAMQGPALPDTAREIIAALYPHLFGDDDSKSLVNGSRCTMEETFPVKLSQLNLMFKLNMLQVIAEIKDANRRELQSLDSFVGGMEQTEWTQETVNGERILTARAWALADAVIVKVMGRDVLAHFEAKFNRSSTLAGRDPLDFFPGFASLWGRHREHVDSFSGVEEPITEAEERAKGRGDAVVDESDDDVSSVRPPPAHYNIVAALNARDPEGRPIMFVDAKDTFAKPLSAFPDAHRAALRAATLSNSSTRVERRWSRMQQIFSSRKGSNMFSLCLMFMCHNDQSMGVELDKLDPELLEAALELARHDGWKKLFELDEVTRDVMNADYKNQRAAKCGATFWRRRNHDGSYRTKRWLTYTPRERKAMDKKITGLKLRLGLEVPARHRPQRRGQGDAGRHLSSRTAAPQPQADTGASATADASASPVPVFPVSGRDSPVSEGAASFDRPDPDDDLHHVAARKDEQAESANVLSKPRADSEQPAVRRSARLADAASEGAAGQYSEYRFTEAEGEEGVEEAMPSVPGAAAAVGEGLPPAAAAEDMDMAAPGTDGAEASAAVPSVPGAAPAVGEGLLPAAAAGDTEMAAPGTRGAMENAEALSAADAAEDSGSGSDSETSQHEIDPESPESDSEPFANEVDLRRQDVWKVEFCENVFNEATPNHPRQSTKVWLPSDVSFRTQRSELVADVTRRPSDRVKLLLERHNIAISAASIKFTVERSSSNLGYIRFDEWAGLQLVKIETIKKPRGRSEDAWARTCAYRRLMTTEEALQTCDEDNDSRGYLGRTSLRLILQADKERRIETYHEGECIFYGDLRGLIGVVRWHPADEAPKAENHKDYPESNLLRMGGRAHEQNS